MRHIMLFLVPALALFLFGCAASATPTLSPTTTVPPRLLGPAPTAIPASSYTPAPKDGAPTLPSGVGGKIVFAPGDGSIWLQDPITAPPQVIIKSTPENFSEAPALSPDGHAVAFRQMQLNPNAPASVFIQLVELSSRNVRALVRSPDTRSDVLWPAFSRDGQWVYYTLEAADHSHSEIRRLKVTGGDSEKVLDDGRQAVLSPDGKQIAFIRFNVEHFSSALWIADADGRNARPLLRDDTFLTIAAPRFSPDGNWILFAASGPPKHELRAQSFLNQTCEPWLLCALAQPVMADGLPWDLWVISPDGNQSRQLTRIGGDSPWPAWSRDGKYIAFFQTNGTYLLDVASGVILQLGRNGGHGIMDWWQP